MFQMRGKMCNEEQSSTVAERESALEESEKIKLYEGERVETWLLTCRCTSVSLNMDLEGRMCLTSYRIWFSSFAGRETITIPNLCVSSYAQQTEPAFQTLPFVTGAPSGPRAGYAVEVYTKDVRRFRFLFCTAEEREKLVRHIKSRSFFVRHQSNPPIFCYSLGESRKLSTLPNGKSWRYDPVAEYERLDELSGWKRWFELTENEVGGRLYGICETYPSRFVVPRSVGLAEVISSSKFRSSERVPTTVWINGRNGATLSRSAQPLSGLRRGNEGDEKLVRAIWEANPGYGRRQAGRCRADERTEKIEECVDEYGERDRVPMYIIDARSLTAAIANIVKGGGYENVSRYGDCRMEFLNIHNIHKVRSSFGALCRVLLLSASGSPASAAVKSSQWLVHVKSILSGALAIASRLEEGSSVLVHCSDGWDRTSQLVSLVELILDPYFRTIKGFCCLVQKEWLSFGHRFALRFGIGQMESQTDESSPVFIQWLDAVYQCMRQCPESFEFTPEFLVWLLDAAQSGRYGTFLFDSEKQREEKGGSLPCVWAYLAELEQEWQSQRERGSTWSGWVNPNYTVKDGGVTGKLSASRLRLWESYFYRYRDRAAPSGDGGTSEERARKGGAASLDCEDLTREDEKVLAETSEESLCSELVTNRRVNSELFSRQPDLVWLQGSERRLCADMNEKSIWKCMCLAAMKPDAVALREDLGVVSQLIESEVDECEIHLLIRNGRIARCLVDREATSRPPEPVGETSDRSITFGSEKAEEDCYECRISVRTRKSASRDGGRRAGVVKTTVVKVIGSRWWETFWEWGTTWGSYIRDTASAAVVYATRK
ncbi:myotubularin-related protein 2-like [Schistocerca gregaria]|uniref:myotubularin-related protein 2-like n=1 Tax=Schistocerca gregaria TaxID=7010 RepID=UPI00211E14E9|nr:myotubularin-related protein 2-like [Schistocerca gregaria]